MDARLEQELLNKVRAQADPGLTVDPEACLMTVNDKGWLVTEASDIGIRAGRPYPVTITVKAPGGSLLKFIRSRQIRIGHGEDEEFGGYVYELLDGTARVSGQELHVLND